MCGRVTITSSGERLAEEFALSQWPSEQVRYNLAPTQLFNIIRNKPDSEPAVREVASVRWGFIPEWSAPPFSALINARSETVTQKPAFRNAFKRRRCLIPVDGFFEWKKIGKIRQPYLFRRADHKPLALAGLWERCLTDPAGPVDTCVILTTQANKLVEPLHDRMPVIVDPASFELWLDPKIEDFDTIRPLFQPFPEEKMESIPVDRCVNDVSNDSPECIQRVTLVSPPVQQMLNFD